MDPAFSLADELNFHAGNSTDLDESELQFHAHSTLNSTLGDEFDHLHHQQSEYEDPSTITQAVLGGLGLDAQLDSLHLHPDQACLSSDLTTELDPHSIEASSSGMRTSAYSRQVGSEISHLATTQTQEVAESIAATSSFLSRLSGAGGVGEDTAKLEEGASRYLTLISQYTAERETQVRELRELDIKVSRLLSYPSSGMSSSFSNDTLFSSSTGGMELPDLIEDESSSLPSSPTSPISPTKSRGHRATASVESDSTITDLTRLTVPTDKPLLEGGLFAPLYTSTTTLLTSLTTLYEHTQITKSSTADAARKLKTLKGLISQWKMEQESVEASEQWISHHSEKGLGDAGKGRRQSEWVEREVQDVKRLIERFEGQALGLLTPVSIAS
ncbi:hypothetical protein NDA18_005587 [Ustilago nuda]|nr:hypothetical protein NDA18_005587 [Ustilago nuda]